MLPEASKYAQLAWQAAQNGHLKQALEYQLRAVSALEKAENTDPLELARVHGTLCKLFEQNGYLPKAIISCEKAWKLAGDTAMAAEIAIDLALLYSKQFDLDRAIFFAHKAADLSQRLNQPTAAAYKVLADLYYARGDLDSALEYAQRAKKSFVRSSKQSGELAQLLLTMAYIYSDLGQREQALEAVKKALDIFNHTPLREKSELEAAKALLKELSTNA